jgi:competence CoiA-like predicted nuclease
VVFLLTAIYEQKTIKVDDFPISFLREKSEEKKLLCPDCFKPVIFKEYHQKQNHFSHYQFDCSYPFREPESLEHETGKKALYDWLSTQFKKENCEMELHIKKTNQRADTFVSSHNIACEFQCSPIQAKTWIKRHELYAQAEVKDSWILGYSMHKYSSNVSTYFHKLNPLEEEMKHHHDGKIIYYDVLTKQFVFLLLEKKIKNAYIGKEYFFKPEEVWFKNNKVYSKYDFFTHIQSKRFHQFQQTQQQAKETDRFIKQSKAEVQNKEKILATSKQINYIKYLLIQSNKKIPYKLHGLLKEEANQLIQTLEKEKKNA